MIFSPTLSSLSPLSGVSLSQPSSLPSPKSTPSPAGPNQPIATLSSTKPATTSILSGTPASSSATPVPIVTQVQAGKDNEGLKIVWDWSVEQLWEQFCFFLLTNIVFRIYISFISAARNLDF